MSAPRGSLNQMQLNKLLQLLVLQARDIRSINTYLEGVQARIDGLEGQKAFYIDQITINQAAAEFETEFLPMYGAIFKGDSDNAADVYVGHPGLTVLRHSFELSPENFIILPIRRFAGIWHISDNDDQLMSVAAI